MDGLQTSRADGDPRSARASPAPAPSTRRGPAELPADIIPFFRWLLAVTEARVVVVQDRHPVLFRRICAAALSPPGPVRCVGLLPGDAVAAAALDEPLAEGFASLHAFEPKGRASRIPTAIADRTVDLLVVAAADFTPAEDLRPWLAKLSERAVLMTVGRVEGLPSGILRQRPWVDLSIAGGFRITAVGTAPGERLRWLTGDVAARPALRTAIESLYPTLARRQNSAAETAGGPAAAPQVGETPREPLPPPTRGSRPVTIRPGAEIELQPDGSYRSTGIDPQLWIDLPTSVRARWAFLRVDVEESDPPLNPVAYVFDGETVSEYRYPFTRRGRIEILMKLPPTLSALRFDPLDQPGTFTLGDVTLRPVGMTRLVGSLWRRDRTAGREIVSLYRTSGRAAATARLLAIYNRASEFHDAAKALQQARYGRWVAEHDTLTAADVAAIERHIAALDDPPLISIVMPVYNTPAALLTATIESVLAQLYGRWELCIADDCSTDPGVRPVLEAFARRDRRIKLVFRPENGHIAAASNSALELATGPFVALLDHDDILPPHALYMVAAELAAHPDADILYSDEDKLDAEGGRSDPSFKSDWDIDRFLSQNMLNHLGVFRTVLMRQVGGFRSGLDGSQDYDLALRVMALTTPERIRHIPFVLYHWRIFENAETFSSQQMDRAVASAQRALADYLESSGQNATVEEGRVAFWHRVRWPVPDPQPGITLIVPTRDRVDLLKACVEGLLNRTDYDNLDVLVADNDSEAPETEAYFRSMADEPRFGVIRVPGPFNFSAINNRAVAAARGSLVGFINNDIEVIEPGWLKEMVSHAVRPGVGAVGARLLYADGSVQHAGISLGTGGIAGHYEKYAKRFETGYLGQLAITRNVSGVTAACLVMAKSIFTEVGCFDAENLTVAFNDVDLCLRIRQAGYRIVWTPFAELYHLESISRGSDLAPEKAARFAQEQAYMKHRWGEILTADPYLSPNISLRTESVEWATPPRVDRPWRRFHDDRGEAGP